MWCSTASARTREITERLEGPRVAAGAATMNIAAAHLYTASYGQAFAMAGLAHDEIVSTRGEADSRALEGLITQGRALFEVGEHAEALAWFERAYAIREADIGADHPRLGRTLTYIGQTRLALGDSARALADLTRALVLLELRGAAAEVIALARFGRAQALWIEGGDRDEAIGEARAARSGFLRAGAWRDRDVDAVEAWLTDVAGVPWAGIAAESRSQ